MKRLFPQIIQIQGKNVTLEGNEGQVTEPEPLYIIAEAKKRPGDKQQTLFTLDHFKALIELDDYIYNLAAPPEMAAELNRTSINFYDMCKRDNITDEYIEYYADYQCNESGYEEFCIPPIEERCEVS